MLRIYLDSMLTCSFLNKRGEASQTRELVEGHFLHCISTVMNPECLRAIKLGDGLVAGEMHHRT